MEFIEKVFVINLESRSDRLSIVDYLMNNQGIAYERFPAIKNENGAKGLVLTIRELFTKCINEGIKTVLILEDDADFLLPNIKSYIEQSYKELPPDYLMFYLGINLLSEPERISQNILRIDQAYSSHAIIYKREAMEYLLPLLDDNKPYDVTLRDTIQTTKRCYASFPMVITQRVDKSDISGEIMIMGKPTNYRTIMATTYATHTKNLQHYPGQTGETIKCYNGHMIDGMVPVVDHNIFEVQNRSLMGRICDCKKMMYNEESCGCSVKQWEVKWNENTNT